jgi:hypothetical protein
VTKPVLARQMPDGSRRYCHPVTGEIVPSVTTVMDVAIAKPKLISWAARQAAQYAVSNWSSLGEMPPVLRAQEISEAHSRTAQSAADKGEMVHELIDKWNKGEAMEVPKGVSAQVNQFVDFMMTRQPVFIENEVTVWSRTYGYAGTADWIAEIDGKVVLGDNKTGKRVYSEVGLQLAGLSHADFIIRPDGTEEPIPLIDGVAVLHIRPRSWKYVPVGNDDANWSAFLAAKTIYDWLSLFEATVSA